MSHTPFCFVHATNVRLDHPLWGIGAVSGPARHLAEEATNLAFAQIIEACVEHKAAFLLLTGNTLDAAQGSRARILLEQACERLAEHDCQVFLVPGESDPAHLWDGGAHLPSNSRIFLASQPEAVPVRRDGLTLATIEPYQDRQNTAANSTTGIRIGLVGGKQHPELQTLLAAEDDKSLDIRHLDRFPSLAGFGYLALGGGSRRATVRLPRGLAHDPGCPQPLDGRQTAALGCTLVEVDSDGHLATRLLPTAIVRREEIAIPLTQEMDWDQLVTAMQAALISRDPLPSERLWLVRWIIDGAGEVIDSLLDPAARQELTELVEAELDDDGPLLRIHEVEVTSRWKESIHIALAGSVYEEFMMLIDEQTDEHLAQFRRGLASRDWPEAGWVKHVLEAAEQANAANVTREAQHLARLHLRGSGKDAA
jgi:DNA repair protein SbcD/Mre11